MDSTLGSYVDFKLVIITFKLFKLGNILELILSFINSGRSSIKSPLSGLKTTSNYLSDFASGVFDLVSVTYLVVI